MMEEKFYHNCLIRGRIWCN